MNSSEARKEFENFIDKIHEFMQRYVECNTAFANDKTDNFTGSIECVQDIEENIWVPRLGLKGKVDVTTKVKLPQKNDQSRSMPLELKTGRASFSPEHTGQLIIYQMMMTEIEGTEIDTGLLLYLREGVMREVKGTHREKRDLMLLRNEISYYLAQQNEPFAEIAQRMPFDKESAIGDLMRHSFVPELPEPINRANICSTCPYNVLCSVYLNQDANSLNSLGPEHPMRKIASLTTTHLSDDHINYFCHWVGLMALENQDSRNMNANSALWLQTAEHRQKLGRTVHSLKLVANVEERSPGEFKHEFESSNLDLTSFEFDVGSYMIVSTKNRYSVAAGPVDSITINTITLILDRNLCDRYRNEFFTIDKYESQSSASFNMSNLGALLDDTESAERLRKIVIERVKPTFVKTLPKIITTNGKPILMGLNANQRTAVLKALTVNEYLLLKGLPGTGKTQTLSALIRLFISMNKSVLITSHTHSAVDNLLLRLRRFDDQLKFIRLGSVKRMHPELRAYSEECYTSNCKTPDELTAVYNQFNLVGVTCLGSGHPLLTQKMFDVCLVDESTQVFQSTVLRPLFSARKVILVGDPDQLPPIIRSSIAKKLGADESLFARLDSVDSTVALTHQYRMNKTIMKLANDLTYSGALICANEDIANATIRARTITRMKWLQRTLSPHIDQAVIFLDTGNVSETNKEILDKSVAQRSNDALLSPSKIKSSRSYTNYCEVSLILSIIKELESIGIAGLSIGIIAPYALQVDLIRKYVADDRIEVNTVDQYQGRDKEVIIYSCTRSRGGPKKVSRSDNGQSSEILEDQRRLTVAITRAKHKLIVIGDANTLQGYQPFRKLIGLLSKMNKINLADQQHGFDWRSLLSIFEQN